MNRRMAALGACLAFLLNLTACSAPARPETEQTTPAASSPETQERTAAEDESGLLQAIVLDESDFRHFDLERELTLSVACSGEIMGTLRGQIYTLCTQKLEEWTGGKLKLRLYDGGVLGNNQELIEAMQSGTVDLMMSDQGGFLSTVPEMGILSLHGLYHSLAQCNEVLEKFTPMIQPYFQQQGLQLLSLYTDDFNIITSNRRLEGPSDLEGLNIRVWIDGYDQEFWQSLGCNPVPMPLSDVYLNMQQGTVGASVLFWSGLFDTRIYNLQKYVLSTPYFPTFSVVSMSSQTWEALTPSEQEAVTQMFRYKMELETACYAILSQQFQSQAREKGMTVITQMPPELDEALNAARSAMTGALRQSIDASLVDQYLALAADS